MKLSDFRQSQFGNQIFDGFLAASALFAAYWFRVHGIPKLIPLESRTIGEFTLYLPYIILVAVLAPAVLKQRGFYRHLSNKARGVNLSAIFEASLLLFLVTVSAIFFLKESPSRFVFLFFVPIFCLLIATRESLFLNFNLRQRQRGQYAVRLILVSDSTTSADFWINQFSDLPIGVQIARTISSAKTSLEEFIQILHHENAGIVLLDVASADLAWAAKAIQACEQEGVEAWLTTEFVGTRLARARFEEILGRNLLVFRSNQAGTWQAVIKIIFDRLVATLLLVFLAPLLLLVWIAIKLESSGSAIFSQNRSGRHGEPFTMYKFRTMHTNAEMQQAELKALNEMSGPVFKIKKDPRVTRVGAFLRFTSLDELPQLFNVFLGQMSLVGPRPLPTYETLAMTANTQRRRLSVSPGMTCLWQISGRNDLKDFSDWVRLDLEYIDQWSLLLDFQILLRTIPAVLFGRGAR